MPDDDLDKRMQAVERLTRLFQLERMVHLGVTTVSLIMLLTCGGILIHEKKAGTPELGMLFGSSGLIGYSASRLLMMWNQAIALIVPQMKGAANDLG